MFHKSYFIVVLLTSLFGHEHSEIIKAGSTTLMSTPRKPCKVPYSKNYFYISHEGNKYDPKERIEGSGQSIINVKCYDSNKIIQNKDFAVCFDGQWYPSDHTCEQKKCDAIYDTYSELHSCTNPEGVPVNCQQPSLPGTKLTIRCANSKYLTPDKTTTQKKICLKNGEWEKWSKCEMKCGLVFNNESSTEKNNSISKVLYEHPWHAVIYLHKDGKWNQHCVGTLMSTFVVVTAHDCFKGNWSEVGPLKIAVGKYYRDYRSKEPSSSQMYDVVSYYRFKPHTIVLLAVEMYIDFSDTVKSVCLDDIKGKFDEEIGRIVAWEKDETGSMARVTKSMKFESNENCRSSKEIDNVLRTDQFCSLSKQHAFVAGDIGSGLVYQKSDGLFYLRGVLGALLQDGKIPIFTSTTDKANRDFIIEDSRKINKWVEDDLKNWHLKWPK